MARIAGVSTTKDVKGNLDTITINLKKHKAAVPVLRELGLLEKSQFEKDWESGISLEEVHQELIDMVNTHYDKIKVTS